MLKKLNKKIYSIVFICISIFFFVGLFDFKDKILSIKQHTSNENTDIVILTGGSNRIKDGLKIINNFDKSNEVNFKILVSGTGKGFTKISLKKNLNSDFNPKLIECCIELDSISKNTYSNASETFKWTKKNNIKKIILITSNYHMPRALLEFKNQMPNLKIFTYPITPQKHNINKWLNSFETFTLILKEYSKFLIARLRIKIT